jgi:hypothetical protein
MLSWCSNYHKLEFYLSDFLVFMPSPQISTVIKRPPYKPERVWYPGEDIEDVVYNEDRKNCSNQTDTEELIRSTSSYTGSSRECRHEKNQGSPLPELIAFAT